MHLVLRARGRWSPRSFNLPHLCQLISLPFTYIRELVKNSHTFHPREHPHVKLERYHVTTYDAVFPELLNLVVKFQLSRKLTTFINNFIPADFLSTSNPISSTISRRAPTLWQIPLTNLESAVLKRIEKMHVVDFPVSMGENSNREQQMTKKKCCSESFSFP